MNHPRVLFAGTPEFALASLQALVASGVVPVAVLTQPDRPAGRGKQLRPSPVKQFAAAQNIPLLQAVTLRDADVVEELDALDLDIMVVAAYGQLLPQIVLDIPRAGCLNVHASLLPRWRGAAPIQAAILAGDKETGVCLMSMSAGLDCGPVFASEPVTITAHESAGELHDRLAAVGGKLLVRHLSDVVDGTIVAREQDETLANYAPKIKTADAMLVWQRTATELERLVRAYNPVPGAFFMLDGERIKCWDAECVAGNDASPGTVIAAGPDGIVVSCGEEALKLKKLQRPGKRPVTAAEFAAQCDLPGRNL